MLVLNPSLLVHQVDLGSMPTYSHLIFALSLAMLAYTGIETVSNMAEEAVDPGRDVPRAVNYILIAVLGVYAGMTVVALSALPVLGHGAHAYTLLGEPPQRSGYQNDPVLGIISHLGLATGATHVLRYYVGVLAATILFIATNAGLIGISRLSWSLAEHRQLPSIFSRLHPRHRTPWFTIVVFSVFAGILLIPGKTDFLGNLYSYGAMLSFTTAHAAIVALRVKDPGRERPYRIGVNIRFRGAAIPVSAVIGGIGTFAAWISVLALHVDARYVGTGWMLVGLLGYVIYRRNQGLDLTSHHKIERRERPAFFVELEYHSAIVPIFGTDVDASALRAAAKLVGEGATVEAIYILRVPNQLSLDAGLEEEEKLGLSVLESAKLAGRKSGLKVQTRLIRTRSPGAAIVEEAQHRNAEIIYLGTAHAPPSERALGPTASYLLAHRPCRVVIETRRRAPRRQRRTGGVPRAAKPACDGPGAPLPARVRGRSGSRPPHRYGCSAARRRVRSCAVGWRCARAAPACPRRIPGPHTDSSRSRWVISRPRLRTSRRSRSNSVGVRWTSWPSTVTVRRARSTSSPSTRITASSGSGAIRRRFACRRATSSRGPNGLVT